MTFLSKTFSYFFIFLLFIFAFEAKAKTLNRHNGNNKQGRFFPRHPHHAPGNLNYYKLNLPGVLGPESLAFDCNGNGPYAGVSDGRILKWDGFRWSEFAITSPNRNRQKCDGSTSTTKKESLCGRPLGLKFHPKTCELYIADAYFGLLKVGRNGGVANQLAKSAEGVPFKFTNDLDIDTNSGVVYFTDSSTIYQRWDFDNIIANGDRTGRLLKYDPHTKSVIVLSRGLSFPNGVVLSKDNSYLLLAESMNYQILKFPLTKDGAGPPKLFANVEAFPDNIRRNKNGEFWVALNSGWGSPAGVKFDEYGKTIKIVTAKNNGQSISSVSEVEEHNGRLWFGSPVNHFVGTMKN